MPLPVPSTATPCPTCGQPRVRIGHLGGVAAALHCKKVGEVFNRYQGAQTVEIARAASLELEALCTEDEPFAIWASHHCYHCGAKASAQPTADCICDPGSEDNAGIVNQRPPADDNLTDRDQAEIDAEGNWVCDLCGDDLHQVNGVWHHHSEITNHVPAPVQQ